MRIGVCCEAALDGVALIVSMAIYSAACRRAPGLACRLLKAGVCILGVQDLCVPGQL